MITNDNSQSIKPLKPDCVNPFFESSRTGYTMQSPITFRLPKPGCVDPYFGAARTFWNERVLPNKENNFRPPVKSFVERKRGARRGIRFISFESAQDYFKHRFEEQEQTASGDVATGQTSN
jgi:hypothetical protein